MFVDAKAFKNINRCIAQFVWGLWKKNEGEKLLIFRTLRRRLVQTVWKLLVLRKLSGTEISVMCPHKKKRNWREELTDFFFFLSLFGFLFLLPLLVPVPLYLSLLCTLLILKHPSKNPADASTSYSAPSYAFTCFIQMEKSVCCLKVHLYIEKTKKRELSDSLLGWLAASSCCWVLMLLEASCVPEWNLRLELVTHRLVLCTVISIDGVLKQPMHQSI